VWLIAAVIAVIVLVLLAIAMGLVSRVLPPGRARELVGFLPNCAVLLRRLRHDHRLPLRARLALGAALVYVLSPVQLIPNFVPVIGQTDDLLAVIAALRYAARRLPRADVEAAWPGDPAYLERLLGAAKHDAPATSSTGTSR
jgi:uncharacterized membrane protein YkvA (DUF1232 family)